MVSLIVLVEEDKNIHIDLDLFMLVVLTQENVGLDLHLNDVSKAVENAVGMVNLVVPVLAFAISINRGKVETSFLVDHLSFVSFI